MKSDRILILSCIGLLMAGVTFADQPAIGFTVLPTKDAKEIMSTNGVSGFTHAKLEGKVIFSGYAYLGTHVWMKSESFQIRVEIEKSPMVMLAADEYSYDVTWYDQKNKKDIFSLRGKIKVGKEPSFPDGWDNKEFTVFFTLEDLKK